jgi:glycerol uptake facilitator-like aquaporin
MTTQRIIRNSLAEFLGTAILGAVVAVAGHTTARVASGSGDSVFLPVFAPLVVGLTIMTLVYLFGGVSGAQFNPAVTISLWAYRKLKPTVAGAYLVAQVVGALVGMQLVTRLLFEDYETAQSLSTVEWQVFFAEALGAFLLLVGVMSVVIGKVKEELSGLVIGMALLVGIALSQTTSGASLNPALAIGTYTWNLSYLLAPILGGLIGSGVVLALHGKQE